MKPILYDKTGKTQLGVLEHCINCFTEEERNGGFTLTLTYPITDELHKDLIYDNIIVVKANDEYDNQQFRIVATERIIKGTVTVKAVHISYDLVYDLVQNVSFEKESCEYALNQLFRNSHFSKHYRGYSNIVNAQKYSANNKNIWEAIVGSTGSIIDTYGKGPEIIRDNTNIHVLNKRGTDRGVVIEYSVNMLDEALEIDASSIVTSIYGFARYTDEENNEHIVSAPRINSTLIDNYAHPFIISKDYTDRFEQGAVPTEAQVQALVELDFQDGIDQPKCNYTVNFVPLSKCAGYENIQDQIHLCDIVTIKDRRYNIDTKANVIKYKYNVLLERYDTMELGDARNTLTQTIVGSTQKDLEQKIEDKVIISNKNYPDTLPKTSIITLHAGLGTIQVDWTYERQTYYSYQLYGSTQQGFTPTSADLLYEGQASSFLHTAAPGSTWYFRVRAKNTHGRFNEFSEEAGITCFIIDENTTYIEKGAIVDAYIGTLNLDRGWAGELKGHWIDARNLTVTDGNGVRTLDIDSYGNVKIDASEIKIAAKSIETIISEGNGALESKITQTAESLTSEISKKVGKTEVVSSINQTAESIKIKASKISLEGYVTINEGFSIDKNGNMTANNGNFNGGTIKIQASSNNYIKISNGSILSVNDGVTELTINDGKLQLRDTNNVTVGRLGRSRWTGTDIYLTSMAAHYGSTVALSASYSAGEEAMATVVVSSKNHTINSVYYKQGPNITAPDIMGVSCWRGFNDSSNYRGHIAFNDDSNTFQIAANNKLLLGVRTSSYFHSSIVINQDSSAVNKSNIEFWGPVDMNNFPISNAKITTSVSVASAEPYTTNSANSNKQLLYVGYTGTDGELRYVQRQTQHTAEEYDWIEGEYKPLGVYYAYCELPNYMQGNIESDYHVNISKLSYGDYKIIEKNEWLFIVESTEENFAFTYEVVAKRIGTTETNTAANWNVWNAQEDRIIDGNTI